MFQWYDPGEDSFTFYDVLKNENLSNLIILDVGCSTGFLTSLLQHDNLVISSDVNIAALGEMDCTKSPIKGDLLSPFNQTIIDCVVFNPPYVPDYDCPILGGGKYGRDVIDRFVEEVSVRLFYLLVIEANKPLEVIENLKNRKYRVTVLKIRKVVGETIIILKGEQE